MKIKTFRIRPAAITWPKKTYQRYSVQFRPVTTTEIFNQTILFYRYFLHLTDIYILYSLVNGSEYPGEPGGPGPDSAGPAQQAVPAPATPGLRCYTGDNTWQTARLAISVSDPYSLNPDPDPEDT